MQNVSDQNLEKLISEAAERMVFRKGEIAYGSAIQYRILKSEQERRQREKSEGKKYSRVFTFELPNY